MTTSAHAAATGPAEDAGLLDVERLASWIGDRLPGAGRPLEADRMGQGLGEGNALYWLRRAGHTWVLRRPPATVNAPGASDMLREWRILTALEGTPVPHPTPRLLCEDPAVLGPTFLIMDRVDGFTPVGALPPPYDRAQARRDLAFAMVDAIAELAQVDWAGRGLSGLGKPEGFLERQVGRWLGQLDRYRTRDIPELDLVARWLEDNRPASFTPGLMHGDYSPFNVMAFYQRTDRLAAIIDWDTGTIGDPLLDIGHLLARWTQPGEEFILTIDIDQREGLPRRAELAARYADRTGADLSALPYYETLSLFKLAIILEGGYARTVAAGAPDEVRGEMIARLVGCAAQFARGDRV